MGHIEDEKRRETEDPRHGKEVSYCTHVGMSKVNVKRVEKPDKSRYVFSRKVGTNQLDRI